jgi:hypothetical protein
MSGRNKPVLRDPATGQLLPGTGSPTQGRRTKPMTDALRRVFALTPAQFAAFDPSTAWDEAAMTVRRLVTHASTARPITDEDLALMTRLAGIKASDVMSAIEFASTRIEGKPTETVRLDEATGSVGGQLAALLDLAAHRLGQQRLLEGIDPDRVVDTETA